MIRYSWGTKDKEQLKYHDFYDTLAPDYGLIYYDIYNRSLVLKFSSVLDLLLKCSYKFLDQKLSCMPRTGIAKLKMRF